MDDEVRYGQFCPVAKAAEIVTTRWTILILRELVAGSHRFNEIHRGVPLMSRGLLSKRLKELETWGVISHEAEDDQDTPVYKLTTSGEALRPIIVALGQWGREWMESALDSDDWDAGVLMWDVKKRINRAALPPGRIIMNFTFEDAPPETREWWIVIDDAGIDLCQKDPGFEIDLYIISTVPDFARVWIGQASLTSAIEEERIILSGDRTLVDSIKNWLMLALVTEYTSPVL